MGVVEMWNITRAVQIISAVATLGLAATAFAQTTETLNIDSFTFESGEVVSNIKLVYQIRGDLNSDKSNAILIPSHYAANHNGYDYLIGAGNALDPTKHCLILTNMFANGVSSSPSNTPAPFDGPRFPAVSIRDNVAAQHKLITESLGITKLKAVVGFSMGAQQAYQWAVSHPDMMESIAVIGGNAKQYPFGIVRLQGSIRALKADASFQNGEYMSPPVEGLKAMAMHYRAWTRSPAAWDRDMFDGMTTVQREQLLDQMSQGFLSLDANNLISQAETWKNHDVGRTPGVADLSAALQSIQCIVLLMPTSTDQYFPVADSGFEATMIPNATVHVIETIHGHTGGGGSDDDATKQINEQLLGLLK